MAAKRERIEARVSTQERAKIDRAAAYQGVSASAFMIQAASDRADEVLARAESTVVPAEYFDALLAALDSNAPEQGPDPLADVVARVRAHPQIRPT